MERFTGIKEKETRVYTAIIKDENGTPIASTSLTTMKLTFYSLHSLAIINTRTAQNVINANNVTIDANGILTWSMQTGDLAILDNTLAFEIHRALFEWTWGAGAKAGKHEVEFQVENLHKVT
jgi:hypothetical protein